eukprot:CAMPEP_0170932248 /NCGR_PEP_ID=MMETSP0735-20130129/16772_1 /TAXON_ID=186038 /ORGANISM="Fragilariopsis kerguelensis, Strain L26-C5" /LENGTH=58 /DNA_ID=CAMNT_0011334495 /DNA_START=55 /DNA_END=227 /DNA_ORIENTATION=+
MAIPDPKKREITHWGNPKTGTVASVGAPHKPMVKFTKITMNCRPIKYRSRLSPLCPMP